MKTWIYQINVSKEQIKRIILGFYFLCCFLAIYLKSSFGHKAGNTLTSTNKKLLYYSYCVENSEIMSSVQLILEISSRLLSHHL